jgi:hypothetical protein
MAGERPRILRVSDGVRSRLPSPSRRPALTPGLLPRRGGISGPHCRAGDFRCIGACSTRRRPASAARRRRSAWRSDGRASEYRRVRVAVRSQLDYLQGQGRLTRPPRSESRLRIAPPNRASESRLRIAPPNRASESGRIAPKPPEAAGSARASALRAPGRRIVDGVGLRPLSGSAGDPRGGGPPRRRQTPRRQGIGRSSMGPAGQAERTEPAGRAERRRRAAWDGVSRRPFRAAPATPRGGGAPLTGTSGVLPRRITPDRTESVRTAPNRAESLGTAPNRAKSRPAGGGPGPGPMQRSTGAPGGAG